MDPHITTSGLENFQFVLRRNLNKNVIPMTVGEFQSPWHSEAAWIFRREKQEYETIACMKYSLSRPIQ
jgi:hypothetical protein